jgi:hypothetical protein
VRYLIIFSIFFSITTWASTWSELETGQNYVLIQEFQLQQTERSRALVDFLKGERFLLKEISNLEIPEASVTVFTFDYINCSGPELSTVMDIISVKDTSPVLEIGAQVEKCELSIYLETHELNLKSIFK